MGHHVRVKMIKRASRTLVEKYYSRLSLDFDTNKKVIAEVSLLPSKKIRNKIAGYVSHLMKRIQRGPVRGISLKLQEEERERRMDLIPERSAIDIEKISIDADTQAMLKSINFDNLPNVELAQPFHADHKRRHNKDN